MEKLFGDIKEFTYDLVGYILPGLIALVIILIYAISNTTVSIYLIELNIEKYKSIMDIISNINLVLLLIISYILGHIVNFISNLIGRIIIIFNLIKMKITKNLINKKLIKLIIGRISNFNKKNLLIDYNEKSYLDELKKFVVDNSKEDKILSELDEKNTKEYLLTKASTNSRFENHNDLIQKYIYKYKFYASLSCVFFILVLDDIWSIFLIITKRVEITRTLYIYIILLVILIISFNGFYGEYNRHKKLREKESYIYLINKINEN